MLLELEFSHATLFINPAEGRLLFVAQDHSKGGVLYLEAKKLIKLLLVIDMTVSQMLNKLEDVFPKLLN